MVGNNLTILAAGTFVRGDIFSDDVLVIEGGVEGNIRGNKVIVKALGWLRGNLQCSSLSIELGGVVDGEVVVCSPEARPALAQAERQALPGTEVPFLPNGEENTRSPEEA